MTPADAARIAELEASYRDTKARRKVIIIEDDDLFWLIALIREQAADLALAKADFEIAHKRSREQADRDAAHIKELAKKLHAAEMRVIELEAGRAAVRQEALISAAEIIEGNQEAFSNREPARYLMPRFDGDRGGLGFAEAIRALIDTPTITPASGGKEAASG